MRILDLGCGTGSPLFTWGISASDSIVGIDIDEASLEIARKKFPGHIYVHGKGEQLPFESGSFHQVISAVAVPYMKIEQALSEIRRVLITGGTVSLSLHPLSFTLSELLRQSIFGGPIAIVFRLYVLLNGVFFHFTGKTLAFVNGRTESFQTEHGMRLALKRAGLKLFSVGRGQGPAGATFRVEAKKG